MTVNLQAIDAKIRKLTKLRELLSDDETRELISDPEMLEMVRSTASTSNGNNHGNNDHRDAQITDSDSSGNGAGSSSDDEHDLGLPGEGTLRRKVLDAARECNGKFDGRDLVSKLQRDGHEFGPRRDPMIAVNQCLRSLQRKGLIRVVRKGSGRQPHLYEIRKQGVLY